MRKAHSKLERNNDGEFYPKINVVRAEMSLPDEKVAKNETEKGNTN